MGLWQLFTKGNCLAYALWDGVVHPIHYNDFLVQPPRIYQETINSISHFFYFAGNDLLVAFIWFSTYHWPSWAFKRIEWNAETGEFVRATATTYWGSVYQSGAAVGSYNSIYTCQGYAVHDVDWQTLLPLTWSWTSPQGFSGAVVNREDDRIAGISGVNAWVYTLSTKEFLGTLRLPGDPGNLTWESRDYLWVITRDGLIVKLRYRATPPRWEMLSSVQNPSPEARGYLTAFDTRRNRLAVLRWLPDAEDGACRLNLEFYRPLIKVASDGLTQPVPVTPVRAGQDVLFVAHLHGDRGEGLGGYFINGALQEPAQGSLLTQVAHTLLSGEAVFTYRPPLTGGDQDTLVLTASIKQDEG